MRVVYDHQIFADQRYGGISRYFFEIARRLNIEKNFDIRLIAGLYVNEYLRTPGELPIQGYYLPRIRKTNRARGFINRNWLRIATAIGMPDVLHETYYGTAAAAAGHTKVVTTVHDMIHELAPQYFPTNAPEPAARKAAVDRASAVICVSEATRRDLELVLGKNVPISVIHHGFTPMESNAAARRRVEVLAGGRPFVLFVGKRGLYKNFDTFIKAFVEGGLAADVNLILFGGEDVSVEEGDSWKSMGLKDGVVTRVDGSDALLAALYEATCAFVYPSQYEGFGMPILEAFSADCPVLCSDIDVFREVAGTAATYCKPDVDGLMGGLQRILEEGRGAGSAVRAQRLSEFSWEKCAMSHAAVYTKIAR